MPRHKLEFDPPETDFLLFGICSQTKDYRLVWIINKKYDLQLKREEDISPDGTNRFASFSFSDKTNRTKYILVSNRSKGNVFAKELKQVDYLFIIEGNHNSVDPGPFLFKLKQSETILAAYMLKPEILRSKQHFFLGDS